MQTLSAKDAKYNFGRLIDTPEADPVMVRGARAPNGGRVVGGGVRTLEVTRRRAFCERWYV